MQKKTITAAAYDNIITVPKEGILDGSELDALEKPAIQKLIRDVRVAEILIPKEVITERIKRLATEIIKEHKDAKKLNLIMVLTGAFMFTADLSREIFNQAGPEIEFHPMKLSTYAKEIKQAGETTRDVEIQLDCADLEDHDIIIIEDIIDQGFTLNELKKFLLQKKKVNTVKICTLLEKRLDNPTEEVKKIRRSLDINYVGFRIPDVWVAGYGIDSGEDFRHLPVVIAVNEECYL